MFMFMLELAEQIPEVRYYLVRRYHPSSFPKRWSSECTKQ